MSPAGAAPAEPVRAFIQARMSSRRFPGKVLAPFRGAPLVSHVVARAAEALGAGRVTVLTSTDRTDDPLAAFLRAEGVDVFRGPLDDVFGRFRACLVVRPCDWVARVSADSPLLDAALLREMAAAAVAAGDSLDLLTNVAPRTYPHGLSIEVVRSAVLLAVDVAALSPPEREHVTPVFYASPGAYRIRNVESGDPALAATSLAVDTLEDLARLEAGAAA